jgi:two-component system phosphate regulon response regulator OmpR
MSLHEPGAQGSDGARLPDDAPHILVVDDDSRIRQLLSRYLGDRGFRVTTAGTAAEARARLAGLAFDVLIVDVMMPGEDGMTLVRGLRGTTNVPILMLTALSESESRVQGLEAGADDYVAKPFDPRELVLRLNNILKRSAPSARPVVRARPASAPSTCRSTGCGGRSRRTRRTRSTCRRCAASAIA